jgi:hypothetical protein
MTSTTSIDHTLVTAFAAVATMLVLLIGILPH